VSFSSDAGRTFGAPVEVDARESDHAPWGPVAVALDDNGHALVLWMTTTGPTETTLNLARVSPDGKRGAELVLAKAPSAHLGGIPQITRAGDHVAVTWLEGVLRRVRAVAVPLAGIPALGSRPRPAAASGGTSRRSSGRGRVGEPAPDLGLVSLDGDKVSLASLYSRAVLLNLWATWCRPCIHEMPELAALHEHYGKKGLVVVGVSVDSADASDSVRAFVSELKIPFAVWLDPEMHVSHALRVRGLPATFVIDREGRIVLRRDRAITADDPELRKALSRALNDS
jgi:peroxiredoxin